MSAPPAFANNSAKKAVHVKWAGKTIALGTFPAAEADEKCARAKALTRAWRSTMRPKPTRDWVMVELERLGVRVVSGRLGRKSGEEGEEGVPPGEKKGPHGMGMGTAGIGGSPPAERSGSIGWGADADLNSLMASRRTSMGLGMMNDGRRGSLGSLGQVVGLDGGDPTLVQRGLAGGFDVGGPERRASSLGLGGLGNMGMSVNPNQHYEMLKLHHMNLLNEIQETTLMMNLYQQQQLQQQQQQLQQQATAEGMVGTDAQISMAMQNGASDPMFAQQRASLGLGSTGGGTGSNLGSPQPAQASQQEDSPSKDQDTTAAATEESQEKEAGTPKSKEQTGEGDEATPPGAAATTAAAESANKRSAEDAVTTPEKEKATKRPKTEEKKEENEKEATPPKKEK